MNQADLDRLGVAVDALNRSDIEPFVGLVAPEMVWKGPTQRWPPWRRFTPT